MSSVPLANLSEVSLRFGHRPLYEALSLSLYPQERVALVGRNGTGKSSLLKLIAGRIEPDAGERRIQPRTKLAYLEQEPNLSGHETLATYILADLPEEERPYGTYRAQALSDDLGLDLDASTVGLSGGEQRRAALVRALTSEPDLLLLDEPTNHLDIGAIEWLEARLKAFSGGLLLISHDRRFLSEITNRLIWLNGRQAQRIETGFAGFETWLEAHEAAEAQALHKLDRKIAEEARWAVEGISARRRRNQGRLRALADLKQERRERSVSKAELDLHIEAGERSGKLVFEAEGLHLKQGERTLIRGLDLRVMRGDRLGLVGPNGAGKTSLLRALLGERKVEGGDVRRGTALVPTWLDQARTQLDPNKTIWDFLADSGGDSILVQSKPRHVVSYAKEFLFSADQVKQPLGSLSGGERNRLLLAKALANPTNLLILDEPTNDLDVETLDLLQDMLANYAGTLVLVSHDRDFLDRVVTDTLALDGRGDAILYAGGYSDMVAQRRAAGLPATPWGQESAQGVPQKVKAPSAKPKAASGRAPSQNGFGMREAAELKAVERDMEKLEASLAKLNEALAAPELYQRDPDSFSRISTAAAKAQAQLEAAEGRWLELETLREAAS